MFERINRAVLRHIERKGGTPRVESVQVTADGFVASSTVGGGGQPAMTRVAWCDVRQVVALLVPGLVGADECLLLDCGGPTLQLTPDVKGLEALLAGAERQLPGWRPAAEWRTALLVIAPGESVDVFHRDVQLPGA